MKTRPRIAITTGEPAGIGPDIALTLLQKQRWPDAEPVLIADPNLLQERARQLDIPLVLHTYSHKNSPNVYDGGLTVLPVDCPAPVTPGVLDTRNADYVLQTLRCATEGCLNGEFSAIVTAPLHKGIINDAGIPFTGHTEFLAELTRTPLPVMMLATDSLRVALATTHVPLHQVSGLITRALLEQVLTILYRDLQEKFGVPEPHILVCGLNPHAGENGYLGREEIDTLIPVIRHLQQKGMRLTGPLPADTLFTPHNLPGADAVLAMYHDQGLPVLKYTGFGKAINITLGLPIIRTSVDHGTALNLAGTGKADTGSLHAAIRLAIDLSLKKYT